MINTPVLTKEQIFQRYRDDSKYPHFKDVLINKSDALEAMEEYATEQSRLTAIGFAKWAAGRFVYADKDIWLTIDGSKTTISTEKLYEMYLSEQTIKG